MPERKGSYTIQLSNRPMILSSAAVVGKKEGEGPLGSVFDRVFEDTTLNEKTWEKAESDMQKEAVTCALNKAALSPSQVQHIFAFTFVSFQHNYTTPGINRQAVKVRSHAVKPAYFYICLKKCSSFKDSCVFCALKAGRAVPSLCKDALVFAPPEPVYYGQIKHTPAADESGGTDRKGRVPYGTSIQLQRRPQHVTGKGAPSGTGRAAGIRRFRPERDGDEPPQQVVRCHHH